MTCSALRFSDSCDAFRRSEVVQQDIMTVRIYKERTHIPETYVGFAFLAVDVDNFEAVVMRRDVWGHTGYWYHVVREDGEETWSSPVARYVNGGDHFFSLTVDLVRRRVLIDNVNIGLDLSYPRLEGKMIGPIGRGRGFTWELLQTEEGPEKRVPVDTLPVGTLVSIASVLQSGYYIRARGESTAMLTVKIISGDITTVETNPKLAVSVSVSGSTFKTPEIQGTSKPEWNAGWDEALSCRSLNDKMEVAVWNGRKKLGFTEVDVRTVEGSSFSRLTLRISGQGFGSAIVIDAMFKCVMMEVESDNVHTNVNYSPTEEERSEAAFRMIPGLADSSDVSFESAKFPSMFLARNGDRLVLARYPGRTSMDAGLALYFYTLPSKSALKDAIEAGPKSFDDIKPGFSMMIDTLDLPAPGVRALMPKTWEVDDDVVLVGVVRGIIDCIDTGDFTFLIKGGPPGGEAAIFVDGEALPEDGKVNLDQGLHDIGVIIPADKANDGNLTVTWQGPLTKEDPVPGYHAASLPFAGSFIGFQTAATFDVNKGLTPGTVRLSSENDYSRAVRVKDRNQAIWATTPQGHMFTLSDGVDITVYKLQASMKNDVNMPEWDFIAPVAKGVTNNNFKILTQRDIEKAVYGECDNARLMQEGGESSSALALIVNKNATGNTASFFGGSGTQQLAQDDDDDVGGHRSKMSMSNSFYCRKKSKGGFDTHMRGWGSWKFGLVIEGIWKSYPWSGHNIDFELSGAGRAQLWVNGELVIDKPRGTASATGRVSKFSNSLNNRIRVTYTHFSGSEPDIDLKYKLAGHSMAYRALTNTMEWRQTTAEESKRLGWRGRYEYRYEDALKSAQFAFRRSLWNPPDDHPGVIGAMGNQPGVIPGGTLAIASMSCGAYLMAPGKDVDGRARLLGNCKSDDEAQRGKGQCTFVNENGFCYKERYQAQCRAHPKTIKCMRSVPSPEYRACKCDLMSCKCDSVPEAGRPDILDPLPLESILDVQKLEAAEAWKFADPTKMLISRCKAQVQLLYVEMLSRPVDPLGLKTFTRLCLEKFIGGEPVSAVEEQIKKALPEMSPYGVHEYEKWGANRKVVFDAVRNVLFRDPIDTVELHKYATNVKEGASLDNVAAMVAFSEEYIKIRNDPAERQKRAEKMVEIVFEEVLMRPASRVNIVDYSRKLVNKQIKVSEMADQLTKSGECRHKCGLRKWLRGVYRNTLVRDPNEGEMDEMVLRRRQRWSEARVAKTVSDSSERLRIRDGAEFRIKVALESKMEHEIEDLDDDEKREPEPEMPKVKDFDEPKGGKGGGGGSGGGEGGGGGDSPGEIPAYGSKHGEEGGEGGEEGEEGEGEEGEEEGEEGEGEEGEEEEGEGEEGEEGEEEEGEEEGEGGGSQVTSWPPNEAAKLAATCSGLRSRKCKKVKDADGNRLCRHQTACGCTPKTCDCGEWECFKAGGKEYVKAYKAQQALKKKKGSKEEEEGSKKKKKKRKGLLGRIKDKIGERKKKKKRGSKRGGKEEVGGSAELSAVSSSRARLAAKWMQGVSQ